MRLKDRRAFSKPEVMIIPMIDIMFFLLVFFYAQYAIHGGFKNYFCKYA